jgi:hypothetical protein
MDCEGIEQSACETMVDILQHYIEELGFLSHMYAEHAGRIECNFNDTQLALKDLQVSMKDVMLFYSQVEDMPFARAIPRFPMGPSQKRRKVLTSSDALPNHIPLYFPPYPDKYSFVNTPLFVEREKDRKKLRSRKNKERTQLEDNLTKFHTSVDTTNLTNYDNPQGIISSDFSKVQPSLPSEAFTQPTPIDADSPFLTLLYQSRSDISVTASAEPEITGTQKEKEKQHHVDSILALNHDKNVIDQLVLEPLPASTTIPTSAPTPSATTPNTSDKYDDMLGRIEL